MNARKRTTATRGSDTKKLYLKSSAEREGSCCGASEVQDSTERGKHNNVRGEVPFGVDSEK